MLRHNIDSKNMLIYVPVARRANKFDSFILVAHALTYILDTCPHHPTLLNALFEVCLSHNLIPESHTVLSQLFAVAILPRPTSPCPLTHPAHKNFLTSLRETCTHSGASYNIPPARENLLINDQTFTRILVDALSQPCPEQLHAWTSKAVIRLARDLREHDFDGCFVPLCAGLAHAVSQTSHSAKVPSKASKQSRTPDEVSSQLRTDAFERLAKWINSMLDTLHQRMPTSGDIPEFRACVDFLVNVQPLGLHVSSDPATSPKTCLADSLCCLAASCLASVPTPTVPATDPDLPTLESILRAAYIKNTTFDALVSYIFPLPSFAIFRAPLSQVTDDTPTPPPTLLSPSDGGAAAIDTLAGPLRARGLLQCEAALYLSALQHVEELIAAPVQTSSPSKRRSEKELFAVRMELMDRVEDAERRCYGGAQAGPGGEGVPGGEQEWVWEELVGSWVVKSPAVSKAKAMKEKDLARTSKRRKLDGGRAIREPGTRSSNGSSSSFTTNSSSSTSTSLKRKASSASTSRTVSFAPFQSSNNKENCSSDHEAERSSDTGTGEPTPAPKRVRNFATILADSHRNTISLRAEREAKAKAKEASPKPRASAPACAPTFAIPESPASASAVTPAPAPWTPVPPSRRSNFASIVEDSHKNAISLREERAREAAAAAATKRKSGAHTPLLKRKQSFYAPARRSSASSDEEDGGKGGQKEARVELESSPVRPAYVEPSSDDALNLFAYPDSSPVKSRRRAL